VISVLLGALAAAVILLLASPLGRWLGRRRRRAAAVSPADRVVVAWEDATEWLGLAGHGRRHWETPHEYARRPEVRQTAGLAPGGTTGDAATGNIAVLADTLAVAAWSEDGVAGDAAESAESAAAGVRATVLTKTSIRKRMRWAVDPRPRSRG
jgi:hypothetical protein